MIYKYYYIQTPSSEIIVGTPNNLESTEWQVYWIEPLDRTPLKVTVAALLGIWGHPKLWWRRLIGTSENTVTRITRNKFELLLKYYSYGQPKT